MVIGPMVIVLMGVSGSGKTAVGERLAAALGGTFAEGDAYHPPANIEKMKSGHPLDDADRQPWLETLAREIGRWLDAAHTVVLACSALKQRYRDRLAQGMQTVRWVYLAGQFELIKQRIDARKGHYMTAKLLESQFAALEAPADALTVDVSEKPEQLAERVSSALALPHR